MLLDTDVLIWVFRGNEKAAAAVESARGRHVSVVSYMELIQGARGKKELRAIKSFLSVFGFEMIPLNENIGHRAAIYMEQHNPTVAMCMADALLAATAVERSLQLCTANKKHYKGIQELDIKLFRP